MNFCEDAERDSRFHQSKQAVVSGGSPPLGSTLRPANRRDCQLPKILKTEIRDTASGFKKKTRPGQGGVYDAGQLWSGLLADAYPIRTLQ